MTSLVATLLQIAARLGASGDPIRRAARELAARNLIDAWQQESIWRSITWDAGTLVARESEPVTRSWRGRSHEALARALGLL